MALAEYNYLVPLPGVKTGTADLGNYFGAVYKLGLTLSVALALVMIVVGGIQYTSSFANPGAKTEALKRIWAAVGGLLLALLSWLILNTINPVILSGKIPI